jgi:hypothetical protein
MLDGVLAPIFRNPMAQYSALAVVIVISTIIVVESAVRLRQRHDQRVDAYETQSPKNKAKGPYDASTVRLENSLIETPYGLIQVYECGPERGKKILCLNGISTPSIAYKGIADRLVSAGYRVMLFGKSYTSRVQVSRRSSSLISTGVRYKIYHGLPNWEVTYS